MSTKFFILGIISLFLFSCQSIDWEEKLEQERRIQKYHEYDIERYLDSLNLSILTYKSGDRSPYSFSNLVMYGRDNALEYSDSILTAIYKYEKRVDSSLIEKFGKFSNYQPKSEKHNSMYRFESRDEIIDFCNHIHFTYFNFILGLNDLNEFKFNDDYEIEDSDLIESKEFLGDISQKLKKWPVAFKDSDNSVFVVNWRNEADMTLELLESKKNPPSWSDHGFGNKFNLKLPRQTKISRVIVEDIDRANIVNFNAYEGVVNGILIRINTVETKNDIDVDLKSLVESGLNFYASNNSAKIIEVNKTDDWDLGQYKGVMQESILEFDNISDKVRRTVYFFKSSNKMIDISFEHSDSNLLNKLVTDRIMNSAYFN